VDPLPIDIDLDAPPEHLRQLAAWYRAYAEGIGRPELAARHRSVAETLERMANQTEEARRSRKLPSRVIRSDEAGGPPDARRVHPVSVGN
jgi:hypothetical protein